MPKPVDKNGSSAQIVRTEHGRKLGDVLSVVQHSSRYFDTKTFSVYDVNQGLRFIGQ